jgi:hypothetical protein
MSVISRTSSSFGNSSAPVRHRPRLQRLVATLLALWLAISAGAPQLAHRCPTHDGAAFASVEGKGHAALGHEGHGGSRPSEGRDECCCPGPQCGASPMVASVSGVRAVAPCVEVRVMARSRLDRAPVTRPAFLLPPATAPPTSLG